MENKSSTIERKVNYAALIHMLPKRGFGYARKVALLLNYNKIKPLRSVSYNANIVHQVVDKDYFDINVEPAIIQLVEDFYGKPIEELLPDYVRRFPKRSFEREPVIAE